MPVAIVHGEASGIVRRFVRADTIDELAGHYGKGEGIIILTDDEIMTVRHQGKIYPDVETAADLVAAKIGRPVENNRCILIDQKTGEIVRALMADPVLDVIDGKILFQHPHADIGWTLDAKGEWQQPTALVAIVDDTIIRAETA